MNILLTSVGRRAYIIDYLRDIYKDLGLIGNIVATNSDMNTTAMSVADKAFESPLIYDEEYIPFLLEICKNEKIDILISLFDIDLMILAKNKAEFEALGVKVIVSNEDVINICNDKFEMLEYLKRINMPVPETYLDLDKALEYGLKKEDVIIDCLTLTVSAQQDQAKETLEAVRRVTKELGLHTTLGVSNISFGLPARSHITENFLIQAMYAGLDLPIVNPNIEGIMNAIYSYKVLSGEDKDSVKYIERFAAVKTETKVVTVSNTGEVTKEMVEDAILKGLKEETYNNAKKLLETKGELEIINEYLIPALDTVGDLYEKQVIFLPQLINAANAASSAFELIKERIANKGEHNVSKGKIVVCTVKGDIHDIGKNIVKVILENYGYRMIDLGRDVDIKNVVDTVVRENVKLVGLSALMTTTLPAMKKTIEEIRKVSNDCKVWVGGAVLTKEYADEMGADFYAPDARSSVDIAKTVLG